ncbi:pathogen-induced calmodulin-binding protein [Trifolium pratense]|uniref:Pathogen-induced calmodulin-binding protein n=1 Tax=Trifolium pratense TaxID=57577 RepID=A0A2K3NZH9_TRIPR|nr:pathogen-induced calmodulin-binding protein [Trifolium pratense]
MNCPLYRLVQQVNLKTNKLESWAQAALKADAGPEHRRAPKSWAQAHELNMSDEPNSYCVSCSNDSTKKFSHKASDNPIHELCNPIKPMETVSSCHEEVLTNGIVEEVPEDLASDLNAKTPRIKSESPRR